MCTFDLSGKGFCHLSRRLAVLIAMTFLSFSGGAAHAQQIPLIDRTFKPVLDSSAFIYDMALQADGRIIIGGNFQKVSGLPCTNLARLTTNGILDASFGGGADGGVMGMIQQPDGKILVSGNFTLINGGQRYGLARLLASGQVDTNFETGMLFQTNGTPFRMAVQPDGKILVGTILSFGGGLVRLTTNGALDGTFLQTNFFHDYWIHSFCVQSNGNILVGGGFGSVNTLASPALVMLDSAGNLNTNFQSALKPNSDAFSIIQETNGGFLIGGVLKPTDGSPDIAFASLTPALTWDTNFHTSPFDLTSAGGNTVRSAFRQADGKIVAGGQFKTVGGYWRLNIVRLNADGQVDPCFDPGTGLGNNFGASSVIGQPDGRILVGGFFGLPGLVPLDLVRFLPQGECNATRTYFWQDGASTYAAGTTTPGGTNFLQSSTNLIDWINLDTELDPLVFSTVNMSLSPRAFFRVKKTF